MKKQYSEFIERNQEIYNLYTYTAMSLKDLAGKYHLSRQRILQIAQKGRARVNNKETK